MIVTMKDRGRFQNFYWPGTPEECWNWTGSPDKDGYGTFWLKDRKVKAHRVSYFLQFGYFDVHLLVLHTCDNPSCVNPNHLFLGSHQDNSDDKVQKQRSASNECNGSCKLPNSDVLDIRELFKSGGITRKELLLRYNISKQQLSNILTNKSRELNTQ